MPVVVTTWSSLWNTHAVRRRSMPWADFVEKFVASPESARRKADVAGFSLAAFLGDHRALRDVEQVFALTLDFDEGDTTFDEAARLFPRVRGVAYSTFSSTPQKLKLRLILLLSRPVTGDEYKALWAWAQARSAKRRHIIDERAKDASRYWHMPSHPIGCTSYTWRELGGRPLDVERVLTAQARRHPLPRGQGTRERKGVVRKEVGARARAAATASFWGCAFGLWGKTGKLREKSGVLPVVCPWADQHTDGADGSEGSTVIMPPTTDDAWGLFVCHHAHCAKRTTLDLLEVLPPQVIEAARIEHGAGLVRACIRRGFVQHLEAHDGIAALSRFVFWCVPLGRPVGAGFQHTVKLGCAAHRALDSLPLEKLLGRRVDVAIRGRKITSIWLVADPENRRRRVGSTSETRPQRAAGGAR